MIERCAREGCDEDIFGIVADLVAGRVPPRIDVTRVSGSRLFLLGSPGGGRNPDGSPMIVGYHVWYCCVRFGRPTVPVRELAPVTRAVVQDFEAPVGAFTCRANPPGHPGGSDDNHGETYDEALAACATLEAS